VRVLVLDGVAKEGLAAFSAEKDIHVDIRDSIPQEQLLEIIGDYHAVIVRSATKVNKKVIGKANKLKVIGRAGVGVDNIDLDEATRRGILVVNAPGGNTISASEYTIAMMLALARKIPQANTNLKNGVWDKKMFIGSELRGKTLGIIGLGRIGSAIAQRAIALEMNVVAYDPFITRDSVSGLGLALVDLDDLFAQSDFITIHTPKTKSTEHILDARAFAKMKGGVRIINCARGGIVNEKDLCEALLAGKVAGAALDVFENEPVCDSQLFEFDSVIVSPHIGASTREAQIKVASDVAHEVIAALKGKVVKNTVNMPAVKPELLSELKHYLKLVEKLGRFQSQMVTSRVKKLEVRYSGRVFKEVSTLTSAVVKGFLDPILQENVNFVNAVLLAKERGIQVEQSITPMESGYANLITVAVVEDATENTVSGCLLQGEPRLVMINGYRVDAYPEGHMLIIPHIDRPGMIGLVGTILGENNINISGMQNSRKTAGGTSVMVISVDCVVPEEVLGKIAGMQDIIDIKMVNL